MPSNRGVVWLWWKSLPCSCPKSLILLFGLCPSLMLRKSSTLCCILIDVLRTCGLIWEFILLDALDKYWNNLLVENVTRKVVVSLTMLFSYSWCERCLISMLSIFLFRTQYVRYNLWFSENLEMSVLVFCMSNSDDLCNELASSIIIQL